jgi:hypothetical protein
MAISGSAWELCATPDWYKRTSKAAVNANHRVRVNYMGQEVDYRASRR